MSDSEEWSPTGHGASENESEHEEEGAVSEDEIPFQQRKRKLPSSAETVARGPSKKARAEFEAKLGADYALKSVDGLKLRILQLDFCLKFWLFKTTFDPMKI